VRRWLNFLGGLGLLTTLSDVADAESWHLVGVGGRQPNRHTDWIDSDTLRRSGGTVQFWLEQLLETPGSSREVRVVALYRADCGQLSSQVLQLVFYTVDGRAQQTPGDLETSYAAPGTVMASAIRAACGLATLSDAVGDRRAASEAIWREGGR
jgi:hypothetical protein